MVESTALEMRHTGNRIVGSNPTLSAITDLVLPTLVEHHSSMRQLKYVLAGMVARSLSHNRGAIRDVSVLL